MVPINYHQHQHECNAYSRTHPEERPYYIERHSSDAMLVRDFCVRVCLCVCGCMCGACVLNTYVSNIHRETHGGVYRTQREKKRKKPKPKWRIWTPWKFFFLLHHNRSGTFDVWKIALISQSFSTNKSTYKIIITWYFLSYFKWKSIFPKKISIKRIF